MMTSRLIEIRFDLVDNISFLEEYVQQHGYHIIDTSKNIDISKII